MGMASRLSDLDRHRVRDFVRHVVEWSGQSWEQLAYRSGVPFTTIQGWRYARATPEAPGLLAFLQAAGLLDAEYRIRAAQPLDAQAAQAALEDARRALPPDVPRPERESRSRREPGKPA